MARQPPPRDAFPSDRAWLVAWAEHHHRDAVLVGETPEGVPAAMLWGTLGYEAWVGVDGSFWEVEERATQTSWTRRDPRTCTWVIATVAGSGLAEWAALLPTRAEGAATCGACEGSGWLPSLEVACHACAGRGWTLE